MIQTIDYMNDSINWQIEEVVVPQHEEHLVPIGMQKAAPGQSVPQVKQHIVAPPDSAAKARQDSIIRAVNDSLAHQTSGYGLVLEPPFKEMVAVKNTPKTAEGGLSWIFAIFALLFCAVCMKMKSSSRYIHTLVANLRDVRTRQNLFDNTVRETTFLILLIVSWVYCAGVLLWTLLQYDLPLIPVGSVSIPNRPLPGIGICCGVSALYVIFMLLAYEVSGNIFTDSKLTKIWVKGATACMGLQVFFFFPLALLALCYPAWAEWILLATAIVFLIGKIQFIYKGFRIFFTKISSLLLFFYYLCSVEVVPLILAYLAALKICVTLL